jgi:hypothetical protein
MGRIRDSTSPQLVLRAKLAVLLTALLLAGCATPSRMYTTNDSSLIEPAHDRDLPLCDTFPLGQHVWVVVNGFEGAREVVLEVSTSGKLLSRHSFPLNSGHVDYGPSAAAYQGLGVGSHPSRATMTYYTGLKIDLGVMPGGDYDLALKTNDVLAAVSHFKVTMPTRLENERQAIEEDRKKLEETEGTLKQLRSEIDHEAPVVDRTNPTMVSDFNKKVQGYNELLEKVKADEAAFNARLKAYTDQLSSYGVKGPQTTR